MDCAARVRSRPAEASPCCPLSCWGIRLLYNDDGKVLPPTFFQPMDHTSAGAGNDAGRVLPPTFVQPIVGTIRALGRVPYRCAVYNRSRLARHKPSPVCMMMTNTSCADYQDAGVPYRHAAVFACSRPSEGGHRRVPMSMWLAANKPDSTFL